MSEHEWWNKPGTGWASLAVSGLAGRTEVLEPTGARVLFSERHEAQAWLALNGYVEAERAVAEGLALSAPPVLPEARASRRLRVPTEGVAADSGAEPERESATSLLVSEPDAEASSEGAPARFRKALEAKR